MNKITIFWGITHPNALGYDMVPYEVFYVSFKLVTKVLLISHIICLKVRRSKLVYNQMNVVYWE
jgi:hypothetical protein